MTDIKIDDFNTAWLNAWSEKDVDRLVSFYAPDTIYKDNQTASGLHGKQALGTYLQKLFSSTPPMVYMADETWAIDGGYCGRWYCVIGDDATAGRLRGFDLVLIRDGLISLNEVYVHQLDAHA